MIIPSRPRVLPVWVASVATAGGVLTAAHYQRLGLTLSHYDARGHLVVARRIIDSITPGWQQIGGVWPPLPHLLNALPVQIDYFYRTGLSAIAISVVAFGVAAGALAWIALRLTDSAVGALIAACVFAFNPNVLYLQSTPMTEPLLLALLLAGLATLMSCCQGPWAAVTATGNLTPGRGWARRALPWLLALACLTRYEAWPATSCALLAAIWVLHRRGLPWALAVRRVGAVAVSPAVAVGAFVVFGRVVTGRWTTLSGFFVPENRALGRPFLAIEEIGWGARALSGPWTLTVAAIGLGGLAVRGLVNRRRADDLIPLSLLAMATLPWLAFAKGHPFRIRYMVPLIPLAAIGVGVAACLSARARLLMALAAILAVGIELRPFDLGAPMVLEAQWDRPNGPYRQRVTDCLRARDPSDKIMASMGSLGHYMQAAAADGLTVRDFLHEGNGDIWLAAVENPRRFAGWLLIEEKAEGGDMLAERAREDPRFLAGYTRVCEGAGLALYKRTAAAARP